MIVSTLRTYIRLLIEEAVTASGLSANVGLIFGTSEWSMQMALVDLTKLQEVIAGGKVDENTIGPTVIGGITASKEDVWRVNAVWAQHGYGPLLYRLAMQYVTSLGSALSANVNGETSSAAERVWKKFETQPNVKASRVEGLGVRGKAYSMVGSDYKPFAARYDSLGLEPKVDSEIRYRVFNIVRHHAH